MQMRSIDGPLNIMFQPFSQGVMCSNMCISVYICSGNMHLDIVYDLHVYLFISWPPHYLLLKVFVILC